MFVRFGKYFVVAALVLTTCAHWAALQTIAWTTMLANNLRTQSVAAAVSQTFDGEHLCPLCRAIAAAKKSEKKADAVPSGLKMEFPPAAEKLALFSPKPASAFSLVEFLADASFQKPPVPPPRDLPV